MSKSVNIVDKNNLPKEIIPKNKNFLNIKGQTFGRLQVLYPCGYLEKDNRLAWLCKCECGNYIIVTGKRLRNGGTKSCGCLQRDANIINNKKRGKEIKINDVFGKLTVIKDLGFKTLKSGKRVNMYLCNCSCGTKNIEVQGTYLNTGDTQSCGCLRSKGEAQIKQILNDYNINYYPQFSYKDLLSENNNPLKFDFAIRNKNNKIFLIEYQGDIHFNYRENGWNDEEHFLIRKKYDDIKKEYCKNNNITLYEITYLDNIKEKLDFILKKEEMLNGI